MALPIRLSKSSFQSTHPVRDVTHAIDAPEQAPDISIHTSREGCDPVSQSAPAVPQSISIHTSREGCDVREVGVWSAVKVFQSTHPVRDVTVIVAISLIISRISIHTSREGCDRRSLDRLRSALYFNPHIP